MPTPSPTAPRGRYGSAESSAAAPPSRDAPQPSRVPIRTGGFYPREYRARLQDFPGEPFQAVSEFDSTTVHHADSTPLIGTALHYASRIRHDIQGKMKVSPEARYFEEDPETHRFLGHIAHQVLPNQSRFEIDLNRPPDTTVYSKPSLAWGLDVYREPLSQYEREFSLEKWYEFHTMMDCAVEDAVSRFGYAVVFDFHSYNYQRNGPTDWRTDGKPLINLGTRHLHLDDRGREIVDHVLDSLRGHTVLGEECLVEENGVFYGGYLNRRLSHLYRQRCITLSVEYKKVYMDEHTGVNIDPVLDDLVAQMNDTIKDLGAWLGVPVRDQPSVPPPSVDEPHPASPHPDDRAR